MQINYIIAFGIVGIFLIAAVFFALTISKNEALLRKRLDEIEVNSNNLEENIKKDIKDLPLSDRLLYPYITRMANFMIKLTPKKHIESLNQKLIIAGNPKGMTATEFMGMQGLMCIVLPLIVLFILMFSGSKLSNVIIITLLFSGFGYLFPKLSLSKQITKRQEDIRKNLPFALDLLTVSVDAGLGFDSALDKVSETMDGPIAEEFSRVLTEIRVGKSRKEALKNMIDRTQVKELKEFVVTIIQADRLGVGLSKLLRVQARQIRTGAKQRAEQKAYKAPVKMLFPMILFIFPSIFIILLGPAVLIIPELMSGM